MRAAILLPVLAGKDAVGNDALAMARVLRERGIETRLFCDVAHGVDEPTSAPAGVLDFAGGPRDLLIYHFSVGWQVALDLVARARGFRIVRYHNITPPEFFAGISRTYEAACARGRAEIPAVARLGCELYLGDSRYNLDELVEHGAPPERGAVLAPLHRVGHLLDAEADLGLLDRLCDGTRNLLMVGRVAPNKGHPDLIDALAALVDGWGDPARLLIVGKSDPGLAAYDAAIRERIARHRLEDHVCWLESVGEAQLKAAYLASQAFVTLSRHEGFCVPLAEAMGFDLPIAVRAEPAMAEVLGDGGVLLNDTRPEDIARAIKRQMDDAQGLAQLAERRGFRRERAGDELHDAVLRLAGGAGEFAVQAVQAGTGVGVDDGDGGGLGHQVLQDGDEHHVLQDVGVVAGMEAVAVAEHRWRMVAGVRWRSPPAYRTPADSGGERPRIPACP